jgi:hypothetical protein
VMSAIRDHVADDNARYSHLARWLDGAADSHPLRDALADAVQPHAGFSVLHSAPPVSRIRDRSLGKYRLLSLVARSGRWDREDQCKRDGGLATLLVDCRPE